MACWLCDHAEEVEKLDWKQEAAEQERLGLDYTDYHERKLFNCRLNPVWIEVRGFHVCGQYKSHHWVDPYTVTERRNRATDRADEAAKLRVKLNDTERRLKKANARIKAIKAKRDA